MYAGFTPNTPPLNYNRPDTAIMEGPPMGGVRLIRLVSDALRPIFPRRHPCLWYTYSAPEK
jgi:hypothetical protein